MLRPVLVLSAGMLLLALADMPYGYYQLLRIVVCGSLAGALWTAWEDTGTLERLGYGVLAVIYNPLIKISMERSEHEIVNVATVVMIGVFAFRHRRLLDAARG